jgi:hypothetical protein
LIENDVHVRAIDVQRPGGTDSRAGTTVGALLIDTLYLLRGVLNPDALFLQIFDAFFEILFAAAELEHHNTLFAGQYGCIEDIENQLMVFGQVANDRLM